MQWNAQSHRKWAGLALIQGINAWRVMPLDTPIEGSKTFDSDDMPFDAIGLIIELFDAFPDEDYGEISDLDDAVVFVCHYFDIVPTFVRRPAAKGHP